VIYRYIYERKSNFPYERNTQKILLVDDEPDILEIVGYNLKQEGYQILLLQMEKKLLQKQKKNPDLIIWM
jgi:two-component system alkaline phosphatase synthesis response regulator PhoP